MSQAPYTVTVYDPRGWVLCVLPDWMLRFLARTDGCLPPGGGLDHVSLLQQAERWTGCATGVLPDLYGFTPYAYLCWTKTVNPPDLAETVCCPPSYATPTCPPTHSSNSTNSNRSPPRSSLRSNRRRTTLSSITPARTPGRVRNSSSSSSNRPPTPTSSEGASRP